MKCDLDHFSKWQSGKVSFQTMFVVGKLGFCLFLFSSFWGTFTSFENFDDEDDDDIPAAAISVSDYEQEEVGKVFSTILLVLYIGIRLMPIVTKNERIKKTFIFLCCLNTISTLFWPTCEFIYKYVISIDLLLLISENPSSSRFVK